MLDWIKGLAAAWGLRWAQDARGNLVVYKGGQGGGEGAPPVILQVRALACVCVWGGGGAGGRRGRGARAAAAAAGPDPLPPTHAHTMHKTCTKDHKTKKKQKTPPHKQQGHVDMVCEANAARAFDFDTQPIALRLHKPPGWLAADGTTLGADNGVGALACFLWGVMFVFWGAVLLPPARARAAARARVPAWVRAPGRAHTRARRGAAGGALLGAGGGAAAHARARPQAPPPPLRRGACRRPPPAPASCTPLPPSPPPRLS